jgi:hypothetical protein
LSVLPVAPLAAQTRAAKSGLTVDEVLQLSQAGLSEDVIVAKIKNHGKPFDLTTTQLLQLKKAGVSDNIIKFMLDPTIPVSAPAAVVAAAPVVVAPPAPRITQVQEQPKNTDPLASRIPMEPSMYYLRDSELVKVDMKTLASAKVAGRLGNVLTAGIKSVKTNAYLIGPSAKTRTRETSPVFYIRLPEGTGVEELVLVSLFQKNDRRELEVGAAGGIVGAKQGLRMETMKPMETQELGPRLYKVATGILGKGEYFFYLVGSADSVKGIQGKGYDFGVE